MANKYFKAILLFAFIIGTDIVVAQGPPPPPPGLPIDGGLIGLLAVGVGYAVKKIYDHSKS
ncbi:PID-CTERM protein-sorting domain-containing protein [Lutimonas sp.]|uniref:PID-CTERM protein-sorting domain-containing protein n=1 Tax=Lutimonas sp. TaxID=1872403 RepID=UPI003D9B7731